MKNNNSVSAGMSIGMVFGVAVGCAIGAATHNMGLWLPVGIGAGMCLGLAFGSQKDKNNEDDEQKGDNNE